MLGNGAALNRGARSVSLGINYKSNKNKEKDIHPRSDVDFSLPLKTLGEPETNKIIIPQSSTSYGTSSRRAVKVERGGKNKPLTQGEDPRLRCRVALVHVSKQRAGAAKNTINIMNYTYFPQILWVCYIGQRLYHII